MEMISPYVMPGIVGTIKIIMPEWRDSFYDYVLSTICLSYKIQQKDIMGSNRSQEFVYVRQLYCYWLRNNFNDSASFSSIGRFLNKDHTTIMHSVGEYDNRLSVDAKLPYKLDSPYETTTKDYSITSKFIRSCLSGFLVKLDQGKIP